MKVEFGYFPKTAISPIPDAGGHFPFAMDGNCSAVIDTVPIDGHPYDFYPKWMDSLNKYPIYAVIQIHDYTEEDIVEECSKYNISYSFIGNKKYKFIKIVIATSSQFQAIFPYIYGSGSMNDLAIWSLKEDIFTIDKRPIKGIFKKSKMDVMVLKLSPSSIVFWVGYDGGWFTTLTNDSSFFIVDEVKKRIPKGVTLEFIEYES